MTELEEKYVKQGAKKVKEKDFQKVVNKGGQILMIPDFLPFIGQIDDAAIFGACLMLVERDLRKYQEWKEGRLLNG